MSEYFRDHLIIIGYKRIRTTEEDLVSKILLVDSSFNVGVNKVEKEIHISFSGYISIKQIRFGIAKIHNALLGVISGYEVLDYRNEY